MTGINQTESTPKEEPKTSGFKFPRGNFEEMFKKMEESCGSGEGPSDCCAMMRAMCGGTRKETDKQ